MTLLARPSLPHRWFRVGRAGAGLALVLALSLPWQVLPAGSRAARAVERLGWRALLHGFGVRLRVHGNPHAAQGALVLANHVSWLDIALLARVLETSFVAKAEVAAWPVIGRLARRHGCVFVARSRQRALREQAGTIEQVLGRGRGLVVFPEGTTGTGDTVLPFRSSLLGAIAPDGADAAFVPVTIAYRDPADRALAAWLGDEALLPHALRLARAGGVAVDVHIGTPVMAQGRKVLAARAEAGIGRQLAEALAESAS